MHRLSTVLTRREWLARSSVLTAASLVPPTLAWLMPWQPAGANATAEVVLNAAPGGLQLADDGGAPLPLSARNWRDTVLIAPREEVELAFVADNPGEWLMHCHIPEHMDAGMLGIVQVS